MKQQTDNEACELVMMNFSGVYREQTFYQNQNYRWIDATDIPGTNGYCDDEAKQQIREKLQTVPVEGIHFLDGGNYHYLSSFWTEKITQPFVLAVFDWHTDMQASAFGTILSCGSWVRSVLEEQPYVKKVLLLGVNPEYYEEVKEDFSDRVVYLDTETLTKSPDTALQEQLGAETLPVYLSVDKDVLAKEVLQTDWDQGTMQLETLQQLLHFFLQKTDIIGIDICGECTEQNVQGAHAVAQNDQVNAALLAVCQNKNEEKEGISMRMIHLEDSIEKHIAIRRVLVSSGVEEIEHVTNVQAGIEKIEQALAQGKPYDFAITDMQYPLTPGGPVDFAGGEKFLQVLREKHIELPVVVCSSMNLKMPEVYDCVWFSEMSNWERKIGSIVERLQEEERKS